MQMNPSQRYSPQVLMKMRTTGRQRELAMRIRSAMRAWWLLLKQETT
jgi:hypothetical protein